MRSAFLWLNKMKIFYLCSIKVWAFLIKEICSLMASRPIFNHCKSSNPPRVPIKPRSLHQSLVRDYSTCTVFGANLVKMVLKHHLLMVLIGANLVNNISTKAPKVIVFNFRFVIFGKKGANLMHILDGVLILTYCFNLISSFFTYIFWVKLFLPTL